MPGAKKKKKHRSKFALPAERDCIDQSQFSLFIAQLSWGADGKSDGSAAAVKV